VIVGHVASKGTDHYRDISVHGRIILTEMDLTETGLEGEYWTQLAQTTVKWLAFVSTVTNFFFFFCS
jgi:hypothetical protein